MVKEVALFLLACVAATLFAAVIAFASAIFWWGGCLLYEGGRSPGWCGYLSLYFYLLWLAVFSLCYWALLRVGKSLDVH